MLRLTRGRAVEARLVERARVVLQHADGVPLHVTARALGLDRKTVARTRRRYQAQRKQKPEASVAAWLADAPRTGRPDHFTPAFWVDVLAVVTSAPATRGVPVTHWSSADLVRYVVEQGWVPSIHRATVSRFLAATALQPHRVTEWMNRPEDPEFETRATHVKQLLADAVAAVRERREDKTTFLQVATPTPARGQDVTETWSPRAVVSFDEKTGMQAKERVAPGLPLRPGRPARQEFEYRRHGTRVLFAMMIVATGAVLPQMRATRTSAVTAKVLDLFLTGLRVLGFEGADVVLDQLNTHWSEALVRVVASHSDVKVPTLRTGAERRAWLETPGKRVVLHFTPKHASWLNPIEVWFGVLVRKVLRRGSFSSTKDLQTQVQAFVVYFNRTLAHPYNLKPCRRAA